MLTMKVNAKKYLNVRAEPNVEAEVVDKLKRGQEVLVTEVREGWAKLAAGYCVARFLELVAYEPEAVEEEPVQEPSEEPAEEPEQADAGGLENMTVPDLKRLAEESGISVPKDARKADIIAAILDD